MTAGWIRARRAPPLCLLLLLLLLPLVHRTSALPTGLKSGDVRIPIKINRQTFDTPPRHSTPSSASSDSPSASVAPEPTYIPSLVLPVPNITHSPSPLSPPSRPLEPAAWASLSSLLSSCFYHRTATDPPYVYTLCPFHNLTQTKLTWGVAQAITVIGSAAHTHTPTHPMCSCTHSPSCSLFLYQLTLSPLPMSLLPCSVWTGWDEEASTAASLVQTFSHGEQCTTHKGEQARRARLHLRCASAEAVAAMGSPLTFTPPPASSEPLPATSGPLGYVSAVAELRRCDYTAWLYTPAACLALPPTPIPLPFNLTLAHSSPLPLHLAPVVHPDAVSVDASALLDCIRRLRVDSSDPCAVQWTDIRDAQAPAPYPYQHHTAK